MDFNKVIFGLYSAGGFAREVMSTAVDCLSLIMKDKPGSKYEVFFIETTPTFRDANGYKVVSEDEFFAIECDERHFNVAIADSKIRERLADRMIERGAKPMPIFSSKAAMYDNNELGQGSIICAFSTVTSNAKIGKFFHSNIYSYVAHDCIIGDYVTFAPDVHCNGNVHIHNHAYIGTGAIIRQGTPQKPLVIGEGAVIGMGAVVTKDVPPFTTVVGNPARPHEKS